MAAGDITLRVEGVDEILARLGHLEDKMAATQADIDTLTAQVEAMNASLTAGQASILTDTADLKTATAGIQEDLDKLAGAGVDVTALQAKLNAMSGTVDSIGTAAAGLTGAVDETQALDAQNPPAP